MFIALAQLNPVVGDVAGNTRKLVEMWRDAAQRGADLLITSELFISGYPPEDFALKPSFLKTVNDAILGLARTTASGPAILVGAPWLENGKLYNAALLLDGGDIVGRALKRDLPNYSSFDEKRVYTPAPLQDPLEWRGHRLGVMICEDMWCSEASSHLADHGAQILVVLNGSPFEIGKQKQRQVLARERVQETGLPIVYVNQFGGQDELVFEGASFVMDASGSLCAQAKIWQEELLLTQWDMIDERLQPQAAPFAPFPVDEESAYGALITGLRDYVTKNGFGRILLGLSGGIDSALVAALAVDAFGPSNVRAVMLPSVYTSKESLKDAAAVAEALGCRLDTISIAPTVQAVEQTLAEQFIGCLPDVTEENIQARVRGLLLMALSNKSGAMLLATGNKSEMATGYATLYGDMCGGFAPLKDVYKTVVYRLARWRNLAKPSGALGPEGVLFSDNILSKAPTAELRPDQKDQDSLPPYEELDKILEALIEDDLGVATTVLRGHEAKIVQRVLLMLDRAEYKRRQAPPGPKITRRHLSRDRRYPITNRYVEN